MRTGFVSSSPASSSCAVVMVRNKKSSEPQKGPDQAPIRITSNVKQNLQFLKLWKEFQKQKLGAPKPATSYRKKKALKEELPLDTDLYEDPTSHLYYTNQGLITAVPVLLVDGYNVCGYWPKLKKHFIKGKLNIARQKLVDELITFSVLKGSFLTYGQEDIPFIKCQVCEKLAQQIYNQVKKEAEISPKKVSEFQIIELAENVCNLKKEEAGWILRIDVVEKGDKLEVKVVAVFDAMMSGLPNHKEEFAGIDVVFTGSSCADAWIEKEVVALREDGCPKVWVVTSDTIQQHAAYGAGAFVWSCKALVSEIKASQKEFDLILSEHRSTSMQGKLLQHNLVPEIVHALKDLKKKLAESESS